jgi:transglutaminase superfamily protein
MRARESLLQLEAAVHIAVARAAVHFVPFRWLSRLVERPLRTAELRGDARTDARAEVRRAIRHASRRLPGATVCFPRALAAHQMLRRRGVATVMYCGASTSAETGLTAHVWLQDGEVGVTGYLASQRYQTLARYPANPA